MSLSATEFRGGDTLTVGIRAANPAGNPAADLYVGVILPDGVTARFFLAAGAISAPLSLSDRSRFPPFRSAPPGSSLDLPAFFQFTFPPAGVPPGTYRVFAALAAQGSLGDGRIDAGDVLPPPLDQRLQLRIETGPGAETMARGPGLPWIIHERPPARRPIAGRE